MSFNKLTYHFFKLRVKSELEYRLNAAVGIIAIALTNLPPIVFYTVLFSKIPSLNGWSMAQMLFIFGTMTLAYGISHTFFSGVHAGRISHFVTSGEFDRFLLRPISVLPHIFISDLFDIDGLGDLVSGLVIVTVASMMLNIQWTLFSLSLYILFMLSGAAIIVAIHIIFSAIAFWVLRTQILSDIFFTIMRFAEYPIDIYNPVIIFIMTVVFPVAFVSYYPSQIFVGKGLWITAAYLTPFVAIAMLYIAKKIWNVAMRSYTSTGS